MSSERNKTIRISEADKVRLGTGILAPQDLSDTLSFADAVINGDIIEVLDLLPDAFADLAIVDPPYNLNKTFRSGRFSAMPDREYEDYLRTWFHGVCSKLKPDGSLYLCGDWKCSSSLQRVLEEELTVMNRITWQREKGRGAASNWKNAMEDIWFGVKDPKHYYFDVDAVKLKRRVLAPYRESGRPKDWEDTAEGKFRLTHPSNFWDDISVPFWSMPENTEHPAQKPEKLMAKLILASCPEGGVVFDPFAGSGSACVTAKKLGRRYVGVEIDRDYCLLAAKRLEMADTDKRIQGFSDGCFWERNSLK
ncbi:MAG: site-specific DNA-methyltransferase [Bacteroidales bacterium]|nr:site-specific DNA-methyltransferase [Bacteroidales bacterium]